LVHVIFGGVLDYGPGGPPEDRHGPDRLVVVGRGVLDHRIGGGLGVVVPVGQEPGNAAPGAVS